MIAPRAPRTTSRIASLIFPLACLSLLGGCATTGTTKPNAADKEPSLTPEQREQNIESFDYVWQTVRDTHWDPNLVGASWDAVRDELRPQVVEAQTMSAARAAMREALDRLGQSHFEIIPRNVYEDMDSPGGGGDGETGLTARLIDGRTLVTAVREGSPAAERGVRPGWEIVQIGDQLLEPMLKRASTAYEESTLHQTVVVGALRSRLNGPAGEPVSVEFLDDDARPVTVELERVEPRGRRVRFGHLPPMYLYFESRRLPDNIGYITFNVFLAPDILMVQFQEAVQSFMDTRGIILDLRGNPGGIGAMSMGMAGWFIENPGQPLGIQKTRGATLRFVVFPRAHTYAGPLAILVDGCTASTAEILVSGLQGLGRARVFGTPTAGAALPAIIERLPNGDGFLHAFADYVSANGRRLEGAGVTPDVEVALSRPALLAGGDPVLEAAVDWILSQGQN